MSSFHSLVYSTYLSTPLSVSHNYHSWITAVHIPLLSPAKSISLPTSVIFISPETPLLNPTCLSTLSYVCQECLRFVIYINYSILITFSNVISVRCLIGDCEAHYSYPLSCCCISNDSAQTLVLLIGPSLKTYVFYFIQYPINLNFKSIPITGMLF